MVIGFSYAAALVFDVRYFLRAEGLSVYLAQPEGWVPNSRKKKRANGPPIYVQTSGPLALKLLKLDHSARWAGLCKLLGLRPEILKSII